MSEPGDELTPPQEQPEDTAPRLKRTPYVALGVAALVVSTVFATVASLASARDDDQASPSPQSEGTVETTTYEADTSLPTTTISRPGTSSSAPKSSSATTTTTTSSTAEETREDEEPTTDRPRPPGNTTQPKPSTTTPPPPENKPPVAIVSANEATCTFDGSGSSDPDGSIKKWEWVLSDGTTGSGTSISGTCTAGETLTATLKVTDDKGKTASAQDSITVPAPTTTSSN